MGIQIPSRKQYETCNLDEFKQKVFSSVETRNPYHRCKKSLLKVIFVVVGGGGEGW